MSCVFCKYLDASCIVLLALRAIILFAHIFIWFCRVLRAFHFCHFNTRCCNNTHKRLLMEWKNYNGFGRFNVEHSWCTTDNHILLQSRRIIRSDTHSLIQSDHKLIRRKNFRKIVCIRHGQFASIRMHLKIRLAFFVGCNNAFILAQEHSAELLIWHSNKISSRTDDTLIIPSSTYTRTR